MVLNSHLLSDIRLLYFMIVTRVSLFDFFFNFFQSILIHFNENVNKNGTALRKSRFISVKHTMHCSISELTMSFNL